MKNIFLKAVGILLIIIGIPGLILPLIPGTFFILAGLSLLGSKKINELYEKLKKYLKKNNIKQILF